MNKRGAAERPRELCLPTVPTVTADTDDDSSPTSPIESLVIKREYEILAQGVNKIKVNEGEGSTPSEAGNTGNQHLASPESTSSGQDSALYAEPAIDDDADRQSTDTDVSENFDQNGQDSFGNDESVASKLAIPTDGKVLDNSTTQLETEHDAKTAEAAQCSDTASESEKRERKLHNIVQEIVDTEQAYVKRLELIHNGFYEEFRERNRREQAAGNRPVVSDETLQKVFRNVREIWRFHADTLLPALAACVADKQVPARPGAVLKKFAPFFKMYTEYTTNYDADMRLLNAELKRNERFAQHLAELQRRPSCCMLTLQQHMLGPIQRIPRYELLLTSYLKYLPEDDADRPDAEAALKLVREAVQKGEMRMKGSEEFKRMLELSEIFARDVTDLIQPTRSLIKEGKVIKVSARKENERAERYLFLFNDLLLVCSQIPFSATEAYKLHGATLKTEGMEVRVVNPADVPGFTFAGVPATPRIALKTTQRQIEFAFEDDEDRANWLAAFQSAARTRIPLSSSYSLSPSSANNNPVAFAFPFIPGLEAPKWIRDSEATMCMVCASPFTAVINRRHHCRSCGHLICSDCSQYRIPLLYGDNKLQRVCRPCYDLYRSILWSGSLLSPRPVTQPPQLSAVRTSQTSGNVQQSLSLNESDDRASCMSLPESESQGVQRRLSNTSSVSQSGLAVRRPSGIDSVSGSSPRRDAAGDPALLKAYANVSVDNGRSWERRFIAVRDDFAIYIYKAHADIHTHETIPLPGYKVNKMKEKERVNAFKISHPSGHVNSWLIQLNDPSLFIMWVEALEHLVYARLPPNATTLA